MKHLTTIALCLFASLAAVGTASAQDHSAKATIPFGFNVGNTWLPAGTYTLASDSRSPNVVPILNAENKVSMLSLGQAADKKPGSHTLMFTKYGDRYFLHEVRCSACRMNVEFPPTKREREAKEREASVAPPTVVYLALR